MDLRLLLWEDCDRQCPGCCNKDWDLDALEVETEFTGYGKICLTGGEPMLYPERLVEAVAHISKKTDAPLIMYTAKVDVVEDAITVVPWIDGITVTLHDQKDVEPFMQLYRYLDSSYNPYLRVNIFKGVEVPDTPGWTRKENMVWIKNCPLPSNEVFRRYSASRSK